MEGLIKTNYDVQWTEKDWKTPKTGLKKKRLTMKVKYNDYIIAHRYLQGNTDFLTDAMSLAKAYAEALVPENATNPNIRSREIDEKVKWPSDTELALVPFKATVTCEFKGAVKLIKCVDDSGVIRFNTEIPVVNSKFHCTHIMRRSQFKLQPSQILEYFVLDAFHKIFTGQYKFNSDLRMTYEKTILMEKKLKYLRTFLFQREIAANTEPGKLDILAGIVEKYSEYVSKLINRRHMGVCALSDKSTLQWWDEADIDNAYAYGFMKLGSLPSFPWYNMMRLTESMGLSERMPVERIKHAIMAPGKWTVIIYPPTSKYEIPNANFKAGSISNVGFTTNAPVINAEFDRFYTTTPDKIKNIRLSSEDTKEGVNKGAAPGQYVPDQEYNWIEEGKDVKETLIIGEHDGSEVMGSMIFTPIFLKPGNMLMHLSSAVDKEHVTIIETPFIDEITGEKSLKYILILPEMGHQATVTPLVENYQVYKGEENCEFKGQIPEKIKNILLTHGRFRKIGEVSNRQVATPLIKVLGV